MRMNCNLFRALRMGYARQMIRYCNTWNCWGYFWQDTFVNWWRVRQTKCPRCGGTAHEDLLGRIAYGCGTCGWSKSNA